MQKSDQFKQVGQVLKSDGTDGSIVIRLFDNFYESPRIDGDFSLSALKEVLRTSPLWIYFDGLPVPFFAELRGGKSGAKLIVGLTDIRTREDADALVGKALYWENESECCTEELDLRGWELVNTMNDSAGKTIGIVRDIDDIPGNPLLVVDLLPEFSSETSETLIPFHEDLVRFMDEDKKILGMDIPEGLF